LLIPSYRGNELNIVALSFTTRQGFLFLDDLTFTKGR
jgi:hypothetical protein